MVEKPPAENESREEVPMQPGNDEGGLQPHELALKGTKHISRLTEISNKRQEELKPGINEKNGEPYL